MNRREFLKAGVLEMAAVGLMGASTEAHASNAEEKTSAATWKIDAFCHILPPKYMAALEKKAKGSLGVYHLGKYGLSPQPAMVDVEERLRIMDKYEGYAQILNVSLPPPEDVATAAATAELAKIANDELAELVYRYPDRFVAATACLPLNDMDAAMKELDRAIGELRFRGAQVTTTIMDKPIDSGEFEPLFARMNELNLPIQIHPRTMKSGVRAMAESGKPDDLVGFWAQTPYNWPFETTIAMGRLVFSGILERYPDLKIITHHLGGVTPYHMARVSYFMQAAEMRFGVDMMPEGEFTRSWEDYYKMFYADTACYGCTPTLMCGHSFFGADHMLFATDFPYDSLGGSRLVPETVRSIEEMSVSAAERRKIYQDNARRLFRLPI